MCTIEQVDIQIPVSGLFQATCAGFFLNVSTNCNEFQTFFEMSKFSKNFCLFSEHSPNSLCSCCSHTSCSAPANCCSLSVQASFRPAELKSLPQNLSLKFARQIQISKSQPVFFQCLCSFFFRFLCCVILSHSIKRNKIAISNLMENAIL